MHSGNKKLTDHKPVCLHFFILRTTAVPKLVHVHAIQQSICLFHQSCTAVAPPLQHSFMLGQ